MSGLKHVLGDAHSYGGTLPNDTEDVSKRKPVTLPALDVNDRIFARLALWIGGFERGVFDGAHALSDYREQGDWFPRAYPIDARHIKLHAKHALKTVATKIAAAQMPANQALTAWLEGYQAGFASIAQGGSTNYHSPEGNPDAEQGE